MKTINIITPHFVPENSPCTNRIMGYVNTLNSEYKINIITLTEKGETVSLSRADIHNTNIYYIRQKNYNSKVFFIRAIRELQYSFKLISKSKKIKCDMTIITIPYMFLSPLAILIRGKKILDIRDIVWEYLSQSNIVNKTIKKFLTALMNSSLKRYDYLIVTNPEEAKYVKDLKRNLKFELITNGIESSKYHNLSSLQFKNTKFTITYVGNIGLAQKLEVLIDVAQAFKELDFLIIGDGAERQKLEEMVQRKNIKNIKLPGKVSWNELDAYYSQTSLLFAQLDYGFESAVPSKLYEYAATGLPILYAGTGEAVNFIKKLENTYVVKPMSVQSIISVITELSEQKQVISENNKNFIKDNFVRENNSKKLFKILESIL